MNMIQIIEKMSYEPVVKIYKHKSITVKCVSLKKKKKDNLVTELDWIRLKHFGFICGIHI